MLAKIGGSFVATLLAVHLAFIASAPASTIPTEPIETVAVASRYNEMTLERFAVDPGRWRDVIIGTSAASFVPPPGTAEPTSYTIALQGGSILTGLGAILRAGARPDRVFVEVTYLVRPIDTKLLDEVFSPGRQWLNALFPMLRQENNAFVLFRKAWAWDFYKRDPWLFTREHLPAWDEVKDALETRIMTPRGDGKPAFVAETGPRQEQLTATRIEELAALVAAVEQQGSEVVFYTLPLHPILAGAGYYNSPFEAARARFADHAWLEFSPEKYITSDGIHPLLQSGYDMYQTMLALP